jgi:hypothetical protein
MPEISLPAREQPAKTAEAILRIPPSRPELLFPGEAAAVHQLYHRLASCWHPDRNRDPKATEVFQRIGVLYAAAKQQIASGCWRAARGQSVVQARDGRQYRIKHFARRPFELGELLLGQTIAAFLVRPEAADLYAAALRMLRELDFASVAMREQVSLCLPQIQAALECETSCTLVAKKPADMVLMADLVDHLDGRVPAVHVAWMLSALYNLVCYLEWARIVHNAIGPDTVLVSPQRHTIALAGGWWYAAPAGTRLNALPQRTVEAIPQDIVRSGTADLRSDLELIRATGRELLGDASGACLLRDPSIPQAMADWLRHPSSGSALIDYRLWRETLQASFGPPRFMRLDVTPEQVYSNQPLMR